MQDRLVETIENDLSNLVAQAQGPGLRKEYSLLLVRVESAKKLFASNPTLLEKLLKIESEIKSLKGEKNR